MYLFVKTVSGNTLNLEVSPSDNIADLKARIQATEGYSVERIRLIHAGKELEDDLTVGDYNIVDESTVFMTLRLVGGGMYSSPGRFLISYAYPLLSFLLQVRFTVLLPVPVRLRTKPPRLPRWSAPERPPVDVLRSV